MSHLLKTNLIIPSFSSLHILAKLNVDYPKAIRPLKIQSDDYKLIGLELVKVLQYTQYPSIEKNFFCE